MTRRVSDIVRKDDRRERVAMLRVIERLAYVVAGFAMGYMLGLLAP